MYILVYMIDAKFWEKVEKTKTCWLWQGAKSNGYGYVTRKGKGLIVHRYAYNQLIGAIPDGHELDHTCRIRHCVNPKHLEPVKHRINILRGDRTIDGQSEPDKYSHKKFLLYIHDPLFKSEKNKSALVNNLLERHYHDTVGGKTQDEVLEVIKTKQDAVKAVKKIAPVTYVPKTNWGA